MLLLIVVLDILQASIGVGLDVIDFGPKEVV
jgi:hypothetical protein